MQKHAIGGLIYNPEYVPKIGHMRERSLLIVIHMSTHQRLAQILAVFPVEQISSWLKYGIFAVCMAAQPCLSAPRCQYPFLPKVDGKLTAELEVRAADQTDYSANLTNGDNYQIITELRDELLSIAPIVAQKMFRRWGLLGRAYEKEARLHFECRNGNFIQYEAPTIPRNYIARRELPPELRNYILRLDAAVLAALPERDNLELDSVEIVWSDVGQAGFSADRMHIDVSPRPRVVTTAMGAITYIQSLDGTVFTSALGESVVMTGQNHPLRSGTVHGTPPPADNRLSQRFFIVLSYRQRS